MKSNQGSTNKFFKHSWRIILAGLFVVLLFFFGKFWWFRSANKMDNGSNLSKVLTAISDHFASSSDLISAVSDHFLIENDEPVETPQPATSTIPTAEVEKNASTSIIKTPVVNILSTSTIPAAVVLQIVPFTSQSPLGEWSDDRFQDACEEASVLMVMKWVNRELIKLDKVGLDKVRSEILEIVAYEQERIGNYHDTSAADTLKYLINDYFNYQKAEVRLDVNSADLIKELEAGNIIVAPTNGRLLKNSNFTAPGPERHMLVIIGYDYNNKKFITNDPGTRRGAGYQYPEKILEEAIADYPSGWHEIIENRPKNVIIVKPGTR